MPSATGQSVLGASWILPLESLVASGAFLATAMNEEALPPDHGAPVRLVIPNSYGCACIKWVQELRFVDRDAPITGQMAEFAGRTEQPDEVAALARDYLEPVIDHAATVVRVERWRVDEQIRFRVVGLAWGGREPPGALTLHVDGESFVVDVQPDRSRLETWALWEHALPEGMTGELTFSTSIADVRTRRLDRGYYDVGFEVRR